MIKIRFVEEDTLHNVESAPGDTSVYAAITNNVPGIDGDCAGGNCACATCHMYVEEKLANEISEEEKEMLSIADNVKKTSRLGCQIIVTEELDGMTMKLPFAALKKSRLCP